MESARLNQIEFLNGAVDIGTSAFEKCYNMEEIVISDTLTSVSIGGSAFSMFAWGDHSEDISFKSRLKTVCLLASLPTLGISAFRNCIDLTTVEMPENLEAGVRA